MRFSLSKDGRKYSGFILFGVVASVALFIGKATFEAWTYFIIPWGALYMGSNVGQKVAEIKSGANSVTMQPGSVGPKS